MGISSHFPPCHSTTEVKPAFFKAANPSTAGIVYSFRVVRITIHLYPEYPILSGKGNNVHSDRMYPAHDKTWY